MSARALRCAALLVILAVAVAQDFNFNRGQVPDRFQTGQNYPDRTEETECRPIRVRILRDSLRFTRDLVINNNPDLQFSGADTRRMTSRMQLLLDTLAARYKEEYNAELTVLVAWADYDQSPAGLSNLSLHYEGRSVQLQGKTTSIRHNSDILRLAIEVGFDWVILESRFTVRLSVIPDLCRVDIDLVWVLDQSGSVGRRNHELALNFIREVHNFFEISRDRTRVGMVTFSTSSRIEFDLSAATNGQQLDDLVEDVPYRGGYTATALALLHTRLLFADNTTGVRPLSAGVPRVAVLLTDGKSNLYRLDSIPQDLKDSGVVVYSVGIGNIELNELLFISSDPDQLYVYLLESYTDAGSFVELMGATLCESPAVVITGGAVFTFVNREEFRYFQSICGKFTINSTVIVEVVDTVGFSFVYVSTVVPNPGPVSPRPYVVANTNAAFRGVQRIITIDFQFSINRTVYVTVEGQENINEFIMLVWEMLFDPDVIEVTVEGDSPLTNPLVTASDYINSMESFTYSITEGNDANHFSIDPTTGAISVDGPLDPQEQLVYNLTVVAENTDDVCQRGRAYVVIFVSPGNTEDPVFQVTTPATVREDAANGFVVAMVTATDQDAGTSGEIVYSLMSGNTNDAFAIDPMSGSISVENRQFLNVTLYDDMFSLTVVATDQGSTPRSATIVQSVQVIDVNEPPFFTSPCVFETSCAFSVPESASVSSQVGMLEAMDIDVGSNADLTFSVTVTTPPAVANPFGITSSGQLTVAAPLDRETDAEYSLEVEVRDGGSPSLSAVATVRITVTDVNDNAPVIRAESPIDVLELTPVGTTITTVRADDPDSGVGGVVEFGLEPIPTFDIDPTTGDIRLAETLDYETEPREYNVVVIATDGGGLSSNETILVRVVDENDHRPIFEEDKYMFSIEENLLGAVGTVLATDMDSGTNGEVMYFLRSSNTPQFQVDSMSGEITTIQELDREMVDSYNLIVEARDGGTPALSSRVSVCVSVTDVNDNPPVFSRNVYEVTVQEDVVVPHDLLVVMATDDDAPQSNNSRIEYSISAGDESSTFEVDPTSGTFSVVKELDFESINSYSLTVTATDFGSPMRLSGMATVRVTVTDVNDNIPVIANNFTVNVSELQPPGTRLAQFNASDMDEGAILTYDISAGNGDMLFAINDSTGLVTLANMLDYENKTQHILTISVSDRSNPESSGFLIVNVINENDNPPVLQAPANATLNEEERQGFIVFSVSVTDADEGVFGEVSLSVTSRPIRDVFAISASGNVTVDGRIDREALSQMTSDDIIIVTVVAQDGGTPPMTASAEVRVMILDINDNNPALGQAVYEASLPEEQPNGTALSIQVTASDPDLGLNGEVFFSISSETAVPFAINPDTGEISSTRRLDRETESSVFEFNVTASDRGMPSRNSASVVMVTVTDVNDNSPVFDQPQFNVTIVENTAPGYNVTIVSATDADQGSNSEIEFGILSGNEDGTFSIDPASGLVSTVTIVDFERMSSYDLTLLARDRGQPSLTGTTRLFVTVGNIDESPPIFDGPCSITLDEVMVEGSALELLNCTAQDYDDGRKTGFPVFYRIESVNGMTQELNHPFSLNALTSILTATRDLDFEAVPAWNIEISGRDPTGNSATHFIFVNLNDLNDNPPVFQNTPYNPIYAQEEQRLILLPEAEDLDTGLNGMFEMAIEGFEAISDSLYSVNITATDFGQPRLTGRETFPFTIAESLVPCRFIRLELEHVNLTRDGRLFVRTLCGFKEVPQDADFVLGQDHVFSCAAISNLEEDLSYQWIHNGSFVTGETSSQLSITSVDFEDAGQYACRASIAELGAIQTQPAIATVLVSPVIVVPPVTVTTEIGTTIDFTCLSVGQPTPVNHFTHEGLITTNVTSDGGRILVTNNLVRISGVQIGDRGDYRCVAVNRAGQATSEPAELVIFGATDVIEITVEEIRSVDALENCQEFNIETFSSDATAASGNTVQMHVINSTGENVCEPSPCSPNPCQNNGACTEAADTALGYTCSCTSGWEGDNCQTDVDECITEPCLFEGNCSNLDGSFSCACVPPYTGSLCQYTNSCDPNPCPLGTVCVETVTNIQRYLCHDMASVDTLSVTVGTGVTDEDLDMAVVQATLENPIPIADETTKRRRRQTTSNTTTDLRCEERFVAISFGQFALVSACPAGAPSPTVDRFRELCQLLMATVSALECEYPDGSIERRPTPRILPPARITIEFVVTDMLSNIPLVAADGVSRLESSGALNALIAQGYQVLTPEPAVSVVQPTEMVTTRAPPAADMTGLIVGVIFGVLGAIIIILLVVGGAIWCCQSSTSGKLVMAGGSEKMPWRTRMFSTVARPRSMAPRADSVVASGYTQANIYGAEFQNPNFVGQWNGNDFEESGVQTSLQDRFAESVIENKNSGDHGDAGNHSDDKQDPKMAGGSEVTGGIRKVQRSQKEAKKLGKSVTIASNETPPLVEKGLTLESNLLDQTWQ